MLDGLAALTALAVGVVARWCRCTRWSTCAATRATPRTPPLVSLFTAAMMLVVVADDLLVLIVGWEVMGLVSYLLIGHHWELAGSRSAAVKAFIVTRSAMSP